MSEKLFYKILQKKKRDLFTIYDLKKVIIDGLPLEIELYPFKNLKNYRNKFQPVKIKLKLTEDLIDFRNIFPQYIFKEPIFILDILIKLYKKIIFEYTIFLYRNLKDFCETPESKLYWNAIKIGAIKFDKLNYERLLWIYTNIVIDEQHNREFIFEVRNSLIPFINPELYLKLEEEKKKRKNSLYEEQVKKINESILWHSK